MELHTGLFSKALLTSPLPTLHSGRVWSRGAYFLLSHQGDGVHAWSCLTLCNPMDYSPPASSVHGDSPGKHTGVGCHALLRGTFPTQGSNLCLLCRLHWQAGSLPLLPPGKPTGKGAFVQFFIKAVKNDLIFSPLMGNINNQDTLSSRDAQWREHLR